MTVLSEKDLRIRVLKYAGRIGEKHDHIRALQMEMLSEIPLGQWAEATTALDAVLGQKGIIHVSNNFNNVGVANTGKIVGEVTGTAQHTEGLSADELIGALSAFRAGLDQAEISTEQREDALAAIDDLEAEAKKPKDKWNLSKVRNGVAALVQIGQGVHIVYELYQKVHPFLAAHFGLPPL